MLHLQLYHAPQPARLRLGQRARRGGDVLHGYANGLEEGDLVRRLAAGPQAGNDFAQLGPIVGVGEAGLHGDDEIAGFGQGSFTRVDEDAGAAHGLGVHLLHVGHKAPHPIDVRAGPERVTIKHGRGGGRGGTDDVRGPHGFVGAEGGHETRAHLRLQLGDEALHIGEGGRVDADGIELAHGINSDGLGARLRARAQHRAHPCVGASQEIGGRARARAGAPGRQEGPVAQGRRLAGGGVQHHYQAVDHGPAEGGVAREDRHDLGPQTGGRQEGGHEQRRAFHRRDGQGHAQGHNGLAGGQLREGQFHGRDGSGHGQRGAQIGGGEQSQFHGRARTIAQPREAIINVPRAHDRMAKKPRTDDLVDWTITYAPEAGEPLPAAAPLVRLPPRPTTIIPGRVAVYLNWRVALLTLSPLMIALLVVALSNVWNRRQLEHDLSIAVAVEEQAILKGNLDALAYSSADAAWLETQLQRAEAMQPAPLPLPGLWPASAPAEVRAVRSTSPNTARADVARAYYAPDGRRAVFVTSQYYHYAGETWVRTAPPALSAGSVTQWRGYYLEAAYYTADEPLVLALAADLDTTLAAACARWSCPAGLRFDLRFLLDDTAPLSRFDHFAPEPSTPWLYTILLSRRDTFEGSLLALLPAPHSAGMPADAASQHVYLSGISLELLARLAAHLSPVGRRHNALPYALAARLGAELGLEAPTVAQAPPGQPVFSADELWRLNFVSTERPFGPYYTQAAQRQALGLVNGLLDGEDPETAGRLFSGLATERDPIAWAARALGTSPEAAAARVQTALEPQALPPITLAADQPLTLGCRDGLAVLAPGQNAPPYALVGRLVDARPLAWSPDGDFLLASLAGRLSVIEALTGKATALPDAEGYLAGATWAADRIVAYTVWPYDALRRRFNAADFALRFYEVARPEQSPAAIAGVLAYALSPDRSTAAVVLADATAQAFPRQGGLYLMPALGGTLRRIGEGQAPAWSPDGSELAWVELDAGVAGVRVLNVRGDAGNWDSSDRLRLGTLSRYHVLGLTWSPAGDRLALTLREGAILGAASAIWLVAAESGQVERLLLSDDRAYPAPVQFSADGRYLSVMTWNPYWPRRTRVYDTATGAEVLNLPSAGGEAAWAPEGHTLAVGSLEGLVLVAEPEAGAVTQLTRAPCYAALWN